MSVWSISGYMKPQFALSMLEGRRVLNSVSIQHMHKSEVNLLI